MLNHPFDYENVGRKLIDFQRFAIALSIELAATKPSPSHENDAAVRLLEAISDVQLYLHHRAVLEFPEIPVNEVHEWFYQNTG